MAERGTFILHFLRSSLLARPYSASLCNLAPSHPNHHVCSFDSFQSLHRHCHCPALPGVGFQSNPRDPCGKVWLFNFLPRGPSALAFPLSLFISFRASRSRHSLPRPSRFAVTHATRPSISLREERSFFSSFIHCSLRDNFTSGEGICRV